MAYRGADPRGHPPEPSPPLARVRRFGGLDAYELVRLYQAARMRGDFPRAAAILDELRELARRPRMWEQGRDDRLDP